MNRILSIFLVFLIFTTGLSPALAEDSKKLYGNVEENLELVNQIGQNILKSNNIMTDIKFLVSEEDHINAYANIKDEIYVYRGLLKVVETEDELAGVIAHEVGHVVNEHVKKQATLQIIIKPLTSIISYLTDKLWINKLAEGLGILTILKSSRSAEYEADITGADLMINAQYNPLGLISILNKISENHLDIISTHPSADKRLVYVYDYMRYNYANKIKTPINTKSYAEFQAYMDEIIKQRLADPEKMEKYKQKQAKIAEKQKYILTNVN